VLYEMLPGELPFSGDSPTTIMYKIVHEDPIKPQQLNRSLPGRIDRILIRALDKAPEKRFPTCTEFAEAVRAALGAAPMTTTVSYQPPSERSEAGRRQGPAGKPTGTVRHGSASTSSRAVWVGAGAIVAALILGFLGWQGWQVWQSRSAGGEAGELAAAAGAGGDAGTPDASTETPGGGEATGGEDTGREGEGAAVTGSTDDETAADANAPADTAGGAEATPRGDPEAAPGGPTAGDDTARDGRGAAEPSGADAAVPRSVEFTVRSEPVGATVTVDGRELDDPTPTNVTLREGQTYRLGVAMEGYESEGLAPFTLDDLDADQIASQELVFRLTSAVPPGRVIIDAPFPVDVSLRGDSLDGPRSFDPGPRHEIEVPAGAYDMTLAAPSVYFRQERRVEIGGGEEKNVPIPPVYDVQVIALPPGSVCTVYIDDREAGTAPLTSLRITEGYHTFRWVWEAPQEASKTSRVRIVRDGQQVSASRSSVPREAPRR